MLFSAFGTNTAFSMPKNASKITHFQTENKHFAQAGDVGFAARAPPQIGNSVAITGGVTIMRGGAFALHRQETVAALFGFNINLNAPNRVPGGGERRARPSPLALPSPR
jgi:hypothetical protein